VLFVGMLSGTYSSICIATPVLADLKERQPEFRQLRKQIAQRAGSARRQAKVAVGNATGAGAVAEDAAELPEPVGDAVEPEAAPVTAARPSGGSGGSAGSRAASGPRQQPRRASASQRRPSGKKKRR
jgi:preprotein translocase subunit SecF